MVLSDFPFGLTVVMKWPKNLVFVSLLSCTNFVPSIGLRNIRHRSRCSHSSAGLNGNNNNNNGGNGRFPYNCNECGKPGHKAVDCWLCEENAHKRPPNFRVPNQVAQNRGNDDDDNVEYLLATINDGVEYALEDIKFPSVHKLLKDPNVWIADTGATTHSSPHDEGMTDVVKLKDGSGITTAKGVAASAKQGNIKGMMCDNQGNELTKVVLRQGQIIQDGQFNLCSLTRLMKDGWKLNGDDKKIWLTKGDRKIVFDIVIPTTKGAIFAIYIKRDGMNDNGTALVANDDRKVVMNIQQAHDKLGHDSEARTRTTAKGLGWTITRGSLKPCEACAVAKAKQKNIKRNKDPNDEELDDKNRLYLDIQTFHKQDDGEPNVTKPHLCLRVHEKTQLKFGSFHESKNGMVEPVCEQLHKWKQKGLGIDVICMDNAGENKALQARADTKSWKLNLDYEYTAHDTPQQNHLAEIGITVINQKGRALMHKANIPKKYRNKIFREAWLTAIDLDGLVVIKIKGKEATCYEHWCGKNPKFAKHLRTWGEAGTVKLKTKTTPKMNNKGKQCVFIGYAKDH